jgi:hypothetical protein
MDLFPTVIAFFCSSEKFMAAFRTNIPCLFVLHPFFSSHLSPIGDCPNDNLFSDRHRKIFNVLTREVLTLVTTFIFSFSVAGFNRADTAVKKYLFFIFGKTPFAVDILPLQTIDGTQPLLEFLVIIFMGDEYAADAAIQPARGRQFFSDFHSLISSQSAYFQIHE